MPGRIVEAIGAGAGGVVVGISGFGASVAVLRLMRDVVLVVLCAFMCVLVLLSRRAMGNAALHKDIRDEISRCRSLYVSHLR